MFGIGKRNKPEKGQAPDETAVEVVQAEAPKSFFARLKAGLGRTRAGLAEGLGDLLLGKRAIDDELLEDIETRLLSADVGIEATSYIVDELSQRVKRNELADSEALFTALKGLMKDMLSPCEAPLRVPVSSERPFVIMVVGVNGVGKTTTIGKLAKRFMGEKRSVMLAAGDTFRAAAVEQLQVWGERNSVPVIAQQTGSDSASVIFDAFQAARSRRSDILIADTAGRLHNKDNLMQELQKVVRVLKKLDEEVPQEVLLVLDATTGQNALNQAKSFAKAVNITGLVISKLDGTARGGMVFAVARELGLPIRFIGIGEQAEDLREFHAADFVDALFDSRPDEA